MRGVAGGRKEGGGEARQAEMRMRVEESEGGDERGARVKRSEVGKGKDEDQRTV